MPQLETRGYSPYRLKDARGWIAKGFFDFHEVSSMTPYSHLKLPAPHQIPESDRPNFTVLCRPAGHGRWGKSVMYRAIRQAVWEE